MTERTASPGFKCRNRDRTAGGRRRRMENNMFGSSRNRATFKDLHAPVVEYRRGFPAEHQPAGRSEFRRLAPAPRPSHAIRSRRLGEKFLLPGPAADILWATARLDCYRNEKHGP